MTGVVVENNNDLMDEFKEVLSNKNIQKAYQLIFDLFSDLKKELKNGNHKTISYASLYHGYLDMTYLPVTTETFLPFLVLSVRCIVKAVIT